MIDLKKHFGDVVVKITVSNDEVERLTPDELADLIEYRFIKYVMGLPHMKEKNTPPKIGHWNVHPVHSLNEVWLECSECGWSSALLLPRKYCPNCGTRMKESEDSYK